MNKQQPEPLVPEIWKPIEGYEDLYEVSNFGRVKSKAHVVVSKNGRHMPFKEKILSPKITNYGYCSVVLQGKSGRDYRSVHRLVASAFIENTQPDVRDQVNHIDGNTNNNFVENLEWCSQSENMKHAYRVGLELPRANEDGTLAKLTNEQARVIRERYVNGEKQKDLAKEYGVGPQSISHVVRNVSFKDAGGPISKARSSIYCRGPNQPFAKLTEEQVVEIYKRRQNGEQAPKIIADMNLSVTKQQIYMIGMKKAYKEVLHEHGL